MVYHSRIHDNLRRRHSRVLAPALFDRATDFIMEHVGQNTSQILTMLTTVLLVGTQDAYSIALADTQEEASTFGSHVS